MRLSTSTNLYCERPGGGLVPVADMLRAASRVGFSVFDMSFYEWSGADGLFLSDSWENWIWQIRREADRLGVVFAQSHAHTWHFLASGVSDSERERQQSLVLRSLDCCRILGVRTVVSHPDMNEAGGERRADTWKKNKEYLGWLVQEADRRGMRLAVENMWDYPGHPQQLFFSDPEEIAAFIDDVGDERLGVCWDFEHGAILRQDQPRAVRILGKRLMALHVSDTVSRDFEPFMHVLPFMGLTDWSPIMQALRETGYQGVFSFEAHNFIKRLPDPLVPAALAYAWRVGNYLVGL